MTEQNEENGILSSVVDFLKIYPESRLEDIYKGFFQDEFGPGHLLSDPDGSKKYLLSELSDLRSRKKYDAEPCGIGQNFYRINLDLILDGFISVDDYFSAFAESAASFRLPSIDGWIDKWRITEMKIRPLEPRITAYQESLAWLDARLGQGKAIAHHSNIFVENYDPHYRIFHRSVLKKYFLKELPFDI